MEVDTDSLDRREGQDGARICLGVCVEGGEMRGGGLGLSLLWEHMETPALWAIPGRARRKMPWTSACRAHPVPSLHPGLSVRRKCLFLMSDD